MTFMSHSDRNGQVGSAYVVQGQVEIARLGPALRQAFGRDHLPSDMIACLDKLDRVTPKR